MASLLAESCKGRTPRRSSTTTYLQRRHVAAARLPPEDVFARPCGPQGRARQPAQPRRPIQHAGDLGPAPVQEQQGQRLPVRALGEVPQWQGAAARAQQDATPAAGPLADLSALLRARHLRADHDVATAKAEPEQRHRATSPLRLLRVLQDGDAAAVSKGASRDNAAQMQTQTGLEHCAHMGRQAAS
eukprot:CAMPEP_0177160608 /NCGR_PEP_ID=MMETSP0367-20130122/4917_1 /TAXON_ID=447022 ORGANISM="Scrippsiella hangoei-like, Strain SHHI-4" /NCGR_SAMPLE_ID=MMETSP0367 /ASSEMBLY_ACC=CAM_ASM_000362 /LENGTH=186 /DNA_ID=CAMNT_0018606273 /DNA_START=47 /DNA_END=605 /DNA_ORIENTATION=-